jgi:hypothetical protein
MKNIVLLCLAVISATNCQEKKEINLNNMITMKKSAIIYGIDYDIQNHFQILVNDNLVAQNFEDVKSSAYLPINEYLLSDKKSILKLKLYKSFNEQYITKDLYKNFSLKLMFCNNNLFEDLKLVQEMNIPQEIMGKSYIEYTYILNVDFDKLNVISGWYSSENLIENKSDLLKQVQDSYIKVFNILNSGSYQDYYKIVRKREEEVLFAYFNAPEILEEQRIEKEKVEQAKGVMNSIDFNKYSLKFYGDGKLITLEDENGDSPLYYEDENYKRIFGILLHRPKSGSPLEVIR